MAAGEPIHEDSPISFLPLGAIIQSFTIGNRNIVLGFPDESSYRKYNVPYFGETIGRYCNRLSEGKVLGLNGRDFDFVKNEKGRTSLHGGIVGWGKRVWDGPTITRQDDRTVSQVFWLHSEDGDEGFPGEVEARVSYTVQHSRQGAHGSRGKEEVMLEVEYEVQLVGEREQDVSETIVAVTNHGYFNISDSDTNEGTEAIFATNEYLEVRGDDQIPTGVIGHFPGIEVNRPVLFDSRDPIIDDAFVLDTDLAKVPLDTRQRPLRHAVTLNHPRTGLHLEVTTTEPSFQFYTGDNIDVPEITTTKGEVVPARKLRSGIAIEPNRYVNAVNRKEWRPLVLLKRGEEWGSRSRFTVWQD